MMDTECTICEAEFCNRINQTFQLGWQDYPCFQIVERATTRGTPKLLDSMGYTYTVRKREANSTAWQCTVSTEGFRCPAVLTQWNDGDFTFSRRTHNHRSSVAALIVARIESRVRDEAAADISKPASKIVKQLLHEELPHAPCPRLPRPKRLEKIANRFREKLRLDCLLNGDRKM